MIRIIKNVKKKCHVHINNSKKSLPQRKGNPTAIVVKSKANPSLRRES